MDIGFSPKPMREGTWVAFKAIAGRKKKRAIALCCDQKNRHADCLDALFIFLFVTHWCSLYQVYPGVF